MPHFITQNLNFPNFPAEIDNIKFIELFRSQNQYLLLVNLDDKEFLLNIKDRGKDFYVGYEKGTRVSPVGLIKNTLNKFLNLTKSISTFENLNISSVRQNEISTYLKDINFFENFDFPNNVCLEIGFGSGRHLLNKSEKNPNTIFLALEIYNPSIEQMSRQIKLKQLKNIFIIKHDARIFLEILPNQILNTIFLHFPVPWDDAIHRRVISHSFFQEVKRTLKKGGSFELRSDSKEYIDYANNLLFGETKIFVNQNLDISSKYEDRWKKMEKDIFDLIFINENPINFENKGGDFIFENYSNIEQKFSNHTIKGEDFFLHFQKLFKSNNGYLLQISMGDFDKPEQKYILCNNAVRYINQNPIRSKANIKAHQELVRWLNG